MTLFHRVTCSALGREEGERFGAYRAQAHLLLSGVEFTPQWHWSLRLFLNVLNKGPAPEPWTSFLLAETFLGLCPHILRCPFKCHHSSETCHYSQINGHPAPPNLLAPLAFLYSNSPTLSALPYSLLVFLHLNGSSLGQGLYPLPCCIFCVWTWCLTYRKLLLRC